MNLYLYSNNKILYSFVNEVIQHSSNTILVESKEDLFIYCQEKSIIILDINYMRDHGFSLASKLARVHDRKCLIIGLCTLQVNYKNSYFDYFYNSLSELKKDFHKIKDYHNFQKNIHPPSVNNLGTWRHLPLIS